MPTTTRTQLKIDILNFWNRRFAPVLQRFAMPLTTSADGSTTTLKDTELGLGTVATTDFNNLYLEIVEAVPGGPADGEFGRVTAGGFNGTETLTFAPAMTAAVEGSPATTNYLLYAENLSPSVLNAAIDRVLQNTEAPHLWFPSLVPDADFDANDVTNWAAVGTPTTRAFNTAAANVLFGERALRIVADAAAEGAQSNTFAVTENEMLLLSVFVKCDVSDARIQLYNETGAAIVKTVTVAQRDWTEVRFQKAAPDNCKLMRVRFLSNSADSDFYIGAPVIVQSQISQAYIAPDWLTREEQLRAGFYLPTAFASDVADAYVALAEEAIAAPLPRGLRQDRGINQLFLPSPNREGKPYGIEAFRSFAALSTNSSTTRCDRDYLVWKTIANLARPCGEPDWWRYDRTAQAHARRRGYGLKESILEEATVVL